MRKHRTSNIEHRTSNETASAASVLHDGETGSRKFNLEERLLEFASAVIDTSMFGVRCSMFSFINKWLSFVRFSHTVFALPFALASMVVAARDRRGWPGWR